MIVFCHKVVPLLLPRPDRRSLLLVIALSLFCSVLDACLFQHKYQLFTGGGFLQPHTFVLFSDRLLYLLAGWLADLTAVVCAFLLYNLLCRMQTSTRSHLWFALVLVLLQLGHGWVGGELYQYFGDNLDWQVLANLVQNAWVHGLQGRASGRIRIEASALEGEQFALSVSDDGKGIAPHLQDRVFEPFFTTRLGQGGSGLGLHIVHNLVTQLMGGQIRVQSQEGKGTVFELLLPLEAPASSAQA